MAHQVFISYSSINNDVASNICGYLEQNGVDCWMAPRNITPSAEYAEQLVEAIESSRLIVLILSEKSINSPQVSREVERAVSKRIPILPFRIEDVPLSKSMEYFISSHHWLDAFQEGYENYFEQLLSAVRASLVLEPSPEDAAPSSGNYTTKKKVAFYKNRQHLGYAFGALCISLFLFAFTIQKNKQESSDAQPERPVFETAVADPGKTHVDGLISELSRKYKENDFSSPAKGDQWSTSRRLSVVFLGLQGTGVSVAEQDFLLGNLATFLTDTNRFTVVEREILDKLLSELHLSSSDLADPATALKLGKILSAQVIATGSIAHQNEEWMINLRFIDTETTTLRASISSLHFGSDKMKIAEELSQKTAARLIKEYPLQGAISSTADGVVIMDIGSQTGVEAGAQFEILDQNQIYLDKAVVDTAGKTESQITLIGNTPAQTGMHLREIIINN